MSEVKIAIIGFSGRDDQGQLKLKHYSLMKKMVLRFIKNELELDTTDVVLVSGGSSWCDHLAVTLSIEKEFAGVQLYLPCDINYCTGKFVSGREATTLNDLHAKFNQLTETDSPGDFVEVLSMDNTKVVVKKGFLNRNTLIAKDCDYLIAFSSGEDIPNRGGTRDTWNKCKTATKIHYSLKIIDSLNQR